MATEQTGRHAERPAEFGFPAWRAVGRRVARETKRDNLSMVAAGVAFYGFLALFPALVALVSIYGLVANPEDVQQMVEGMRGVVPSAVADIISQQLSQVAGSSGSSLGIGVAIGILVALWSATKGTKSLMTALDIAYEEEEQRGFFRYNGVALLLTLGAVLLAIVAIGLVVAAPAVLGNLGLPSVLETVINWLRWPMLAVAMIAGLAVLYRYGPSRRSPRWSWVNYGSVAATLLFLVVSALFSWYVSNFGSYNETYGSLAAIVILLLWFYISAYAVLLGAELNSEMEHQTGRDTTTGEPRPRGSRDAEMADRVAGEDEDRFKA